MVRSVVALSIVAMGCSPTSVHPRATAHDEPITSTDLTTSVTTAPIDVSDVRVTDVGLESGYQDMPFGSWQRGRAAIAADFDADGRVDVAVGNPGDVSYILQNATEAGGPIRFEVGQILVEEEPFWGGAAADLDNDGDADLFMGVGGNEGEGFDRVWVNDGTGLLVEDQTSGVWQTLPDGTPLPTATASAIAWDFDNDGWLDVFGNGTVNAVTLVGNLEPEMVVGLNPLWRNNADGTFTDVGRDLGLSVQMSTRNSTVLDFDRDGDLDLFENNWIGPNVLWRNRLAEDGIASFEDVTQLMSLGGGDLSFPYEHSSMCTIASDLNQDGWEDLLVFRRWPRESGEPAAHGNTHLVWINLEGGGFVEVSAHTVLADTFVYRDHSGSGVMGCQIADLDADGTPDLFMGNGGPEAGQRNNLFVSGGLVPLTVEVHGVGAVSVPQWSDWSALVDFPAPHALRHDPEDPEGDVYPYRTHGTMFADFDGDGLFELGVHNGGPSTTGTDEEMQEPNRLFHFDLPVRPHWLRLELVGDGEAVNRDGIGASVRAVVSEGVDGPKRDIYERRRSSTGFGAQNQPDVFLGLGTADTVHQLEITWPDGTFDQVDVPQVDARIRIERVAGSVEPVVTVEPVGLRIQEVSRLVPENPPPAE